MKIRLSLPNLESKYLGHDSPLIKAVGFGIFAFLLLSSLTVFAGVRAHIAEYLEALPIYLAWPGYGIGYAVFSLAPDALNVVCIAFVARSILLGHCKDARSLVLIVVCLGTSYYLTDYSYRMSQVSAEALARNITPEEQAPDLVSMDSVLQAVVSGIGADFDKEYQRVSAEFDTLIARSNRAFEARKAPHVRQIATYQRNRQPSNTQWTDKQIDRQQRKIEPIEAEQVAEETRLSAEKREALDQLRQRRALKEERAQTAADTSKSIVITSANRENGNIEAVTTVLINQLSGIAGKSVFILLALAVVREILRNRNEIQPVPVWSEFDFGGNPISEVLMFLPTLVGRFILRQSRDGYEGIRAKGMPSPERPGILYDWTTANNQIEGFEQPDGSGSPEAAAEQLTEPMPKKRRPARRQRQKTTASNKARPIGFNVGYSQNKTTAKTAGDGGKNASGNKGGNTGRYNGPVTEGETTAGNDGKDRVIYKEVDTSLRECLKCGETYKPRAHNQKFCSRRCKDAYHTENHAVREFDPAAYHRKKK